MTSGEFTTVPLRDITINRGERQRRELTGIEELARSISAHGLIHPLVVTRDHVLVAGERRYTALMSLGHTHVPVQYTDEVGEVGLHLIELEENIRREDISWQDRCLAFDKYFELRKSQDPKFNGRVMCNELNIAESKLSQYFLVAKEIKGGNARVINQDNYSTAIGVARREVDRRNASTVAIHMAGVSEAALKPVRAVPLLHMEFKSWLETYDGPEFNLLHCDFPYGVGIHDSDQGSGKSFGTYSDTPDDYWTCLSLLEEAMGKVVGESSHLLFWFSLDYYDETVRRLESMGWSVNPFPLVWWKSDNVGILPDAQRGPRRVYETCLLATVGDRKIVRPVSNLFGHPGGNKEIHMNEKPVAMLKYFMGMVCDEYSVVLDPTAGSGNALKAATALGSRHVLGLERDREFFERASAAYYPKGDDDV